MADTKRIGGIHYEMMKSCYNPKSIYYHDRGAKGIKVCDEWHDREVFRKWCKDNGFKNGMQVLRKDTSKDFCPDNCYVSEPKTRAKHGYNEMVLKRAKYNKERKAKLGLKRLNDHPLKGTYASMHYRCENPHHKNYNVYGGRGIKVCDEWSGKDGKYNFIQWAQESGWRPGLTLDRIDPDKGYSPDNCRWATSDEQARNRRTTIKLPYKGHLLTIKEIAILEKIDTEKLRYRISRKHLSLNEALEELHSKEKRKEKNHVHK